jgi:DNA-binding FrmR family transcriptional regulator
VKKMIEEGRGCFDILKQVGAASGALRSLQKVMLEQHIQGCLEEALRKKGDREQLLGELVKNLSGLSS